MLHSTVAAVLVDKGAILLSWGSTSR